LWEGLISKQDKLMVLRVGHRVSTPQPWLQMVVEGEIHGPIMVQAVQGVLAALAMVAAMAALVELP
jgi:hypothetical protein